jgi:ATP-dependent Clp protease protease subunit
MRRSKLSQLMDAETWMNANKAIEYGFADGILEDEKKSSEAVVSFAFSRKAVANSLLNKLQLKTAAKEPTPHGRSVDELKKRLNTIKNYI